MHGRGRLLTGHLRDDDVEVGLVLVVDEPVVEHALTLVTEETEGLSLVPDRTRTALQHAWKHTATPPGPPPRGQDVT